MTSARLTIVALFVIAALVVLALRWDTPREDIQSGKIVEVSDPGGLAVRGGLNSNTVESGEILFVWMVLHNRSQHVIGGLRFIDVQIPGFREAGTCWIRHAPACRSDGTRAELSGALAPGESVAVSGQLTPAAGSGRYGLLFTYGWANPAGGELRHALMLGPVEVTTWWRLGIVNLSGRLQSLMTDLALPVILLVAGWILQRLQKERENRQKQEEEAAKKAEDTRLQRQTQTAAVLNTLLESNLKDTQKYYLPFAARLDGLMRQITAASTDRKHDRQCFHAMMVFLRQQQFMVEGIGGFHFQSRRGEAVVAAAWHCFRHHLNQRFPLEIRSGAMKAVTVGESLFDFNQRMEQEQSASRDAASTPLIEAEQLVTAWVHDRSEPLSLTVPVLDIIYAATMFELNRPFEYWYGRRESFPTERLTAAKAGLPTEPAQEIQELHKRLDEYFREGDSWNNSSGENTGT